MENPETQNVKHLLEWNLSARRRTFQKVLSV